MLTNSVFATQLSSGPHSSAGIAIDAQANPADMEITSGKPRSHAPEASSFILLSTGIMGYIVRFARRKFQQFKRCFDIVVACLSLILALPILAIAGAIVKITSPGGSIFYKQKRVGKDGINFDIFKLRTMKPDAEKESGAVWARENDSRLIPFFGKLFRKTHVDELPQFINVLRGEMSIVGPRPERPEFVKQLKQDIPDYEKRLTVNPGITGLAQVWHKYDETLADVKKKIKYDLLYIRKMCLMVDLRILFKTIFVVLTGQGAR